MQILVTGGSGFIGSHVVEALKSAEHNVTNLDIRSNGTQDNYVQGDIRDMESLKVAIEAHGKDAVYHIGAIANARQALEYPVSAVDINIGGTAAVLEAARQVKVKRVFLASTVWVYNGVDRTVKPGDTLPKMLDESEKLLPTGAGHFYSTSKIASELLCHDFFKLHGQEFTILRFGIPYGPRMWPGLALRAFMDNVFSDQPIRIFGDGSAVRRFVYVEDLARAHVLALSDVARNQTYNLEGGRDVTIKELAETVVRHVGKGEIEYVVDPSRRGELSMEQIIISNDKAKRDLDWSPSTPLDEGVRRTIDWYKKELNYDG